VLREKSPHTRIIVCEPDNSPVLGSGLAQPRNPDGSPAASHPSFRPHLMQGWSPDFIPKLTEDAVAARLIDRVVPVNGARALELSRELARREGIFAGISGGATLAGALTVCAEAPAGATVLCMLPDTGERYLSTPLFADVASDMTSEELAIARSTPNYRFDVAAPPAPAATPATPLAAAPLVPAAREFVAGAVADAAQPVVMFALEWCEFCWAVRKFLARLGIVYRSVDLDSVEYQKDDRGGQIRAALTARTGMSTIPQVFVGGELVGGCTDVFDAYRSGRLQQLFEQHRVGYERLPDLDPYSFLPGWLHPR
jgi:cysteine synthase A